jgi:hypothetical protein
MTMWPDTSGSGDLFGLAGSFPQPGWVVIDAARHHRYTGELEFFSSPPTRVYFDAGRLYFAERISDPSIGARLVDAGVVTAAQIEWGTVHAGGTAHLGRLFDRVPNLDRDAIVITTEVLTEECVRWLATQPVPGVDWAPYRHHPSGMHAWCLPESAAPAVPPPLPVRRPASVWDRSAPAPASSQPWAPMAYRPSGFPPPPPPPAPVPAEASPATATGADATADEQIIDDGVSEDAADLPTADEAPVRSGEARRERTADDGDDLVEWAEPSWFGTVARSDADAEADAPTEVWPEPAEEEASELDWVARLEHDGLPDPDPYRAPTRLPKLPVEPVERFEIVWPSGEIDEEFGSLDAMSGSGPDQDRVATAPRLGRLELATEGVTIAPESQPSRRTPSDDSTEQAPPPARVGTRVTAAQPVETDGGPAEVVLAVRRAVAAVDSGSLADRRRVADTTEAVTRSATLPAPTGTAADSSTEALGEGVAQRRAGVRPGRTDWSPRTVEPSVLDEPAAAPVDEHRAAEHPGEVSDDEHDVRRAGALRRLITSLRR